MINAVTGIFALVVICVFLGYYAISINSLPLWVIIGAILVMIAVDVVQSIRSKDQQDTEQKTD